MYTYVRYSTLSRLDAISLYTHPPPLGSVPSLVVMYLLDQILRNDIVNMGSFPVKPINGNVRCLVRKVRGANVLTSKIT